MNLKRRIREILPDNPNLWTPEFAYLTAADETTLAIAFGLDFLTAFLRRMGDNPETRALPPDLLEWEYVDVSARAWGIRHYREASAAPNSDPASTLKTDKDAIGLVVFCDGNPSHSLTMRYISKSADAEKHFSAAAKKYSEESEFFKMHRISSVAWEAKYVIYPSTADRPQTQAFRDSECRWDIITLFSPLLGISDRF